MLTLVIPEVDCFRFVSNDINELNDATMMKLLQDLNLSDGREWKTLLLLFFISSYHL